MTFNHNLFNPQAWSTELAIAHLLEIGQTDTKRTAERRLHELGILPTELSAAALRDESDRPPTPMVLEWEIEEARARRKLVLFAQLSKLPGGIDCLHANDARGARYWVPLERPLGETDNDTPLIDALTKLRAHIDKDLVIFPHGTVTRHLRAMTPPSGSAFGLLGYQPVLDISPQIRNARPRRAVDSETMSHLDKLEAESIYIMREVAAEAENPVMLYSIGKDSAVMLHLARKAFYPAPPPFPLLHVDTRWKFQEMYQFRDYMAQESGMDLLVHVNPEAIEKDINPFDHGSALHTDVTKTEGLKQALDKWKFDVAFGGARRDEEKSRAKERIFSFRTAQHRWEPKCQRPELWNLYNSKKRRGESIRAFPISNWTELDIWQYIYRENIPLVPLYFAKERPVVERNGMLLMIDDARMRLLPGEKIERRKIRFRTLGCYPLSGAIESESETLPEIILELMNSHVSERQGRAIDNDQAASMEKKKQEGYF
nr:sulfate adenylyltransferase subunit CysD [Ferriphaselus sp. R-1]